MASVSPTAKPFSSPESTVRTSIEFQDYVSNPFEAESALDDSDTEPPRPQVPQIIEPTASNRRPQQDRSDDEPVQTDLPFGDGATKIFGMENFGASCYCNSIVQSLYYTKMFRRYVLSLPEGLQDKQARRKRRTEMPGLKVHHFISAMQNSKLPQLDAEKPDEKEDDAGAEPGKRRMSFFGKKKPETSRQNSVVENEPASDDKTEKNDLQEVFRATSSLPGLKDLKLGFEVANRNVTVVGVTEDPNATSEQRKRRALIDGPILNMDHALTADETMLNALKDIFECMVENASQTGIVSPSHLILVLKRQNELFRSMMHQDAHEFFNFLLNSVFESLDEYYKARKQAGDSPALEREIRFSNELFEGLLTSQTKCLCCEKISSRDEKFLDLSIDLENNTSITACLKQFSANEILCEDNKFYCENCSLLQEATKRMVVKKLPEILTLHLKRFKYSEKLNRNVKLFHRVAYPLYLRLFNTLNDGDVVYELYSVVVHIGGGPYHGHYVSLVKTEQSGWLLFDDETVESIDENFVLRFFGDGPGLASAYILFYQQISQEEYLNKTLYSNDLSLENEHELAAEMEPAAAPFKVPDYTKEAPKSAPSTARSDNGVSDFEPKNGSLIFKGQRSKSISLKSPLSNSFKFSDSTGDSDDNKRKSIFGFNKKQKPKK